MRATIIREPWIGLILRGEKSWEMRSRPTSVRETIGLIPKGSGQVVATARLSDCLPALSAEEYGQHERLHRVPPCAQSGAIAAGWVYPWVLTDIRPLIPPIPYRHRGGVTWVVLDEAESARVAAKQTAGSSCEETPASPPPTGAGKPARSTGAPAAAARAGMRRSVELTAGNIKHKHIYLASIIDFFPPDAIGGSNKAEAAAMPLSVTFGSGDPVETDIAGDKKILRVRSAVIRRFFEDSGARPGDIVDVIRTGLYSYDFKLKAR